MQAPFKCACKYQNPLEYICTHHNCNLRRVICQSCAWDHRAHERSVKPLIQWKEEMTNDCVIQRLNHIKSNQTQVQCLDQFTKMAQGEIVLALKSKCDQITAKLKGCGINLDQTLSAIKQVASNEYANDTINVLIKEFPSLQIHERLDELELEAFKKTQTICQQIVRLMDQVQDILDYCEHKPSSELKKLRIQMEDCLRKADQPRKPKLYNLHQEEEKDDKINEFLQKLQQQPIKADPQRQRPVLSQSSLNYMRFNEDMLKSDRSSFYLSQKQSQDFWNEDLSNSRAMQNLQPLSTKSNPYNNVMLQKKQEAPPNPNPFAQGQNALKESQVQSQVIDTSNKKARMAQQRPSLQQFYLSKLSNQKKDGDDVGSKSFYEFSQQKK